MGAHRVFVLKNWRAEKGFDNFNNFKYIQKQQKLIQQVLLQLQSAHYANPEASARKKIPKEGQQAFGVSKFGSNIFLHHWKKAGKTQRERELVPLSGIFDYFPQSIRIFHACRARDGRGRRKGERGEGCFIHLRSSFPRRPHAPLSFSISIRIPREEEEEALFQLSE